MKRIYLSSPTIHDRELEYVKDAFDTNWVAPLGPNVNNFESEVAEYAGVANAAALSSGTAAIHLALKLLDIGPDDKVLVSSFTFSASCNPIMYVGATPIFIDSELDTWNMSPQALERACKSHPDAKALICVHLYGTPAKLDEIMRICEEYDIVMIEDAAESMSSTYKGKQTGTFGRMGIYSFNGNKIITSSGGGMLVSDDEELIDGARFLSTQARDEARHYQHSQIGYNYRMSNIVAGIGRGQLGYIEEHKRLKQAIYSEYSCAFSDIDAIKMNPMNADGDSNNWLSCITIDSNSNVTPNMVMDALELQNIEARPLWKPMHLQPVYSGYEFYRHDKDGESVSGDLFDRGMCLPSDIKNTNEDMNRIISIVRGLFI